MENAIAEAQKRTKSYKSLNESMDTARAFAEFMCEDKEIPAWAYMLQSLANAYLLEKKLASSGGTEFAS